MTNDRTVFRQANSRRNTLAEGAAEVRLIAADAATARQVLDTLNRCYPSSSQAKSYSTRDGTGARVYVIADTCKGGESDGR